MSSFEWNKIIASVLTAMILAMVSGILATQLVRPKALEKPVFLPAGAEQVAAASAEQPAAAKLEPIEPLLADTRLFVPKTHTGALQADKGTKWDPEKLNQWLYSPQSFAKGTKMAFAGFPKPQDRADVIAYLNTLK